MATSIVIADPLIEADNLPFKVPSYICCPSTTEKQPIAQLGPLKHPITQELPLSSPASKDTSSTSINGIQVREDSACFDVPPQDTPDMEWAAPNIGRDNTLAYVFIFVNPLSGGQKGDALIALPFQNFRPKQFPHIIVTIHNMFDQEDRTKALNHLIMLQDQYRYKNTDNSPCVSVWSAGGDGTVMGVYEMLLAHSIDTERILFSCIPLGTGNDVSQVLGWGRTIPHGHVVGKRLENLNSLVTDRILHGEVARLDIWDVEMTVKPVTGHIQHVQKGESRRYDHSLQRKMCSYMSLGVQGFVGSGFEKRRTGNRLLNMMVYALESAKWVFWRRFPPVTSFISSIEKDGAKVLRTPVDSTGASTCRQKINAVHDSQRTTEPLPQTPELSQHPIDVVVQNIPHIWGREIDLWGDARSGLESVKHRQGPTDPRLWYPQRANDGRLEIIAIHSLYSYIKKLANVRSHVSRVGQFESPFEIKFHSPQSPGHTPRKRTSWERENTMAIMCDGEFYLLKDPQSIRFTRSAQLWTLARCDGTSKSRLVADEQAHTT